jgi:hypothetical protein
MRLQVHKSATWLQRRQERLTQLEERVRRQIVDAEFLMAALEEILLRPPSRFALRSE